MSELTKMQLDPWSFLDFKGTMAKDQKLSPTWVDDHWRRLQAYKLYDSYYRNMARKWWNNLSPAEQDSKREYGDPGLVVEQFLASLLGNDFGVVVEGAVGEEPDENAVALQEMVDQWMIDEKYKMKVIKQERQVLKLGDGVWVGGWSKAKNRPVWRVYDPGMFFPVWDDDALDDEFPNKVHIAYEFEKKDALGKVRTYVRRITYELVPFEEEDDSSEVPVEENEAVSCFMSDGTWLVNEYTKHVDDFDESRASWRVKDLDLGYDFIPVVHEPNGIPESDEMWGVSVLALIVQVLDDVINNDTDLNQASGLVGSPILAVKGGASLPRDSENRIINHGPGTVYETEEGLDVIDMSRSLDALLKDKDSLLERVAINSRLPEALMGRVKPSEVPSGIALWLSFGPHTAYVEQLRMMRHHKYGLKWKFTQRMWQKEGMLPGDEIQQVTMQFGSYLPADRTEALTMVTQAMNATKRPMSLVMAVKILQEAGFPIEDAQEEVDRIIAEDFSGAEEFLNATGDLDAARDRLGLDPLPTIEEIDDSDPLA